MTGVRSQGRRSRGLGSWPLKICRRDQNMFWHPYKNVTFFHSKLLLYNCKFHSINDEQFTVGHYHFTDLAYADDATILMSDQLQADTDSVLQSINAFAAILGLKLSWPKTKLWYVGAGDPPSKILIDGVSVEGVEEFIYRGSKQSYNGYCRLDVLRRIGLACSVVNSLQRVWNCSSLGIITKVHLFQSSVHW